MSNEIFEEIRKAGKWYVLSPQENAMLGCGLRPGFGGDTQRNKIIGDFYTPVAILDYDKECVEHYFDLSGVEREDIIKYVAELREEYGTFDSVGILWEDVDIKDVIELDLSPINPETGETVWDPESVKRVYRLKEHWEKELSWRTLYLKDEWRFPKGERSKF